MKKQLYLRRFIVAAMALLILCCAWLPAAAESYSASTIRLVRYDGDISVVDSKGKSRFVMVNSRFASGETVHTGEASSASISLDAAKILYLDQNSSVRFEKQGNALKLILEEGTLLLDVQEKLDDDETLDIQTTTLTVGIRGTIALMTVAPSGADPGETVVGSRTQLTLLEGKAEITYQSTSERGARLTVPAGQSITLTDLDNDGSPESAPVVKTVTVPELTAFVKKQMAEDPQLQRRIETAITDPFAADGDWQWDGTVTFVAQSASKLYDGKPLVRPEDILIYGLPQGFSASVSANGSQTSAGESANPISRYAIYNPQGENVTSHFTSIETVDGRLVVDRAPLTIWTGSAEKVYDGEPLTCEDAGVRGVPGYERDQPLWRNTSYVSTDAGGSEVMYSLSGSVWVHGTNPLTGETQEIVLHTGQRMQVYLSTEDGQESIVFQVEDMQEAELPVELLRLYAANPDLLAEACAETGWDPEVILALAAALPEEDDTGSQEAYGLTLSASATGSLMQDCTDVRIHIDTDITNYNGVALSENEAHFTDIYIDDSIIVTATGTQTDVGESENTYTIDWGTADPDNYTVSTDLGTLTVTAAQLTVSTGSASKPYDGTPLTEDSSTVTGLVSGETVGVTVTGSQTDVGVSDNTFTLTWGSANRMNYTVNERPGTLEVTGNTDAVTFTAGSASKVYDGTPLTCEEITVDGLPADFDWTATVTGSQTDAGESGNVISSYAILHAGQDVTASFVNVSTVSGTLTVTPASLAVTTGSASKVYDGTPLTEAEITVTGLADGDTVEAAATGEITTAGTADNTYAIEWGGTNPDNYSISETLGTLTVEELEISVDLGGAPVVYSGAVQVPEATLTYENGSHAGETIPGMLVNALVANAPVRANASLNALYRFSLFTGDTVELTVTGAEAGAGTYTLTGSVSFSGSSVSFDVSITGTVMTVTPRELTITTSSAEKQYDGVPLTSPDITVEGLAKGDDITVTATGSQADLGASDNTYTIDWGDTDPDNYTVTDDLGTLEVTVNDSPIVITAPSHTWVYDGQELSVMGGSTVTGVPEALEITVTAAGSRKDVGTSATTVSYYIMDPGLGKEVSANFSNITKVDGALTVTPAALTITTGSAEKTYDGTALTCADAAITGLVGGETAAVTATGTITDVGTAVNTYSVEWGTTDPNNYTVAESLGKLEVTAPPALTITAASAEKVYDGTPLSSGDFTVDGLPSGFTCHAVIDGSQTDKGTAENTVTSYTILDASEADATANFSDVTTVSGTLTVTPLQVSVALQDKTYTYDREGHVCDLSVTYGNGDHAGEAVPVSGSAYTLSILEADYTLFTGDVLRVKESSGESSVGTHTPDVTVTLTSGNPANYTMPVSGGTVTIEPAPVTVTSGSATREYDGTPLTKDEAAITGLVGPDSTIVTVTATGSVTDVGTAVNTCAIDWGTVDPGNYALSEAPGTLEVTANTDPVYLYADSASREYDGTPLTSDAFTYEMLGGFTPDVTVSGSQTDAGSSANRITDWRIMKGSQDVTAFFTNVATVDGTLTVTPKAVTVTTGSGTKVYDGTPLTKDEAAISGLVPDEAVHVTATGTITGVGTADNTYAIDWGTFNKNNYTVTDVLGTLKVTANTTPITITSGSSYMRYKPYDCIAKSSEFTVEGLPDGFTATATMTAQLSFTVGSIPNTIDSYQILDAGSQDATAFFTNVTLVPGKLTIDKAIVNVWSNDLTKVYDNRYATPSVGWEGIYGMENAKTGIGVQSTPTLWEVGTTTDDLTYWWKKPELADLYEVELHPGTLKIVPLQLEVSLGGGSILRGEALQPTITYVNGNRAGQVVNPTSVTATGDGYTAAFKLSYEYENIVLTVTGFGSGDVGTHTLAGSCTFNTTSASNFDISYTNTEVTVNALPLTISTGSANRSYNGEALTSAEVTVTGLADGDEITVTADGTITDAGSTPNTYTIDWGTVNKDKYEITEALGTLTVTKASLTVETDGATKTYDGTPLTKDTYTVSGLAAGEEITVTTTGTITDAGTAPNTYSITWSGADEGNYEVTDTLGVLTVSKRPATISTQSETQVYNGQPIVATSVPMTGFVAGEYPDVTATGYQKDVGTSDNTYTINSWSGNPDNYTITETLGTLTVTKRTATVTTGSMSKPYDGTPLTSDEANISGLVPDETATVTANGTITDVGTTDNTYDIAWGSAKSGNYEISESLGTLEVTSNAMPITVTAASPEKTYDGTALTCEACNIDGVFPEGVVLTATYSGSQVDAGSSESKIVSYKLMKGSQDVTAFFTGIETQPGTLTVHPAPATVTTGSATKAFDGTPLTKAEANITGLISGETATVTATGTITDVGSTPNTYTIDWDGAKAGNYTITESLGTLEVTGNTAGIVITARSSSKAYDATPLTNSNFTVTGLPDGYTCTATVEGSQTDKGTSDNTVTAYTILDSESRDVTASFTNVTTVKGSLTINPKYGSFRAEGTYTYDGYPHTGVQIVTYGLEGYTITRPTVTTYMLKLPGGAEFQIEVGGGGTDVGTYPSTCNVISANAACDNYNLSLPSSTVTIKPRTLTITTNTDSKTYDGTPLTGTATVTGSAETDAITVTAASITNAGSVENSYTIDWNGANPDNYKISATLGTLTVSKAPLTITTGSASKTYDGTPLTSDLCTVNGLADGDEIAVTTTGTITDAGTTPNTYSITWSHADENNYEVAPTLGVLTVNKRPATISTQTETQVYNGQPIVATSVPMTGFVEGEYPDVTATGYQKDVGTSDNTYTINSWSGNPDNYTITETLGTLTVTKREATVTTGSASKPYDGTPLTEAEAGITGLAPDETVTVTATGTITDVGTSENTYSITWGTVKSSNYELTEELGTLTVTANDFPITVTAASPEKTYDGTPLTCEACNIDGVFPEGVVLTATYSGSQVDAGSSESKIVSYKIMKGSQDVTAFFTGIETQPGTLTVNPAPATITTGSATKVFDGTPLTNAEANITGLMPGETATVTATGTITDVGSTPNTYTIDWDGAKAGNYTITESLGTLEVTGNTAGIVITARSSSKAYDATPLTNSNFTVTGLPDGYTCTATVEGSQTDKGTSDNTVTAYTILDSENRDVTASFTNVTTVKGSLTINPKYGIFRAEGTEIYNGYPQTGGQIVTTGLEGYTITRPTVTTYMLKLPGGAEFQIEVGGGGTDVGTYPSTCNVISANAACDNYNLSLPSSTVTIKPRTLTITTNTDSKTYDGTPLTGTATVTGIASVDAITVTAASITNAGSVENSYTIDWNGANPDNYKISATLGTLTVSKREATINTGYAVTTYNGTTVTNTSASLSGFVEGERPIVTTTGSRKDAGSSANTYNIDWGSTNKDNYEIKEILGTLTVYPKNITVKTGSASKEYDGTPLTSPEVSVMGLISGETATAVTNGTITDIGSADNTYTISWGSAKEGNYKIVSEEIGTLTVTANTTPVTITAGSVTGVYNGMTKTCSDYTVEGLPSGFTAEAVTSGEQKLPGTSDNTITSYTIYNQNDEDCTSSFTGVSLVSGKLTVTKAPVTVTVKGKTKTYDGTPLNTYGLHWEGILAADTPTAAIEATMTSGSIKDVGSVSVEVTASLRADLKDKYEIVSITPGTNTVEPAELTVSTDSANKEYDGMPLTAAVHVDGLQNGETVTAVGASLTNAGSVTNNYTLTWDGTAKAGNYTVTDGTLGTLAVSKAPLTITTGSASKTYDGTPLTSDLCTVSVLADGDEIAVATTGTITDAGTAPNTYSITWSHADENNYEVTPTLGVLTVSKRPATISTQTETQVYNGQPIVATSVPMTGFVEGEYPDVTVTGYQKDVGTSDNTYTINSWSGNPDNYTITETLGTLTVTKRTATVTTGSASKPYDGTPLTNDEANISGLVPDETAIVTANGTITDVGTADNTYSITWGSAKSGNYEISESLGTLEVTSNAMPITVTAASPEKTYDGTPLTCEACNIDGVFPEGVVLTATYSGSQTDAGSSESRIVSYKIMKGSQDVTAFFTGIETQPGTLTVHPAPATVTTGSATKVFDGTPLTKAEANITGLISGETATVTAKGTITNVGSTPNTYTIDWNGTAKAGNYTVTDGTLGTLTVSKAPLTITTGSASRTYDGTPLTSDLCTVSGLADGDEISVATTGTITDAGTAPNTYSITWSHADENNYEVTPTLGVLTVSKRPATISTQSETQVYNGQPIVATSAPMTGFVEGEYPDVTVTGYQKDVGTSDNTYTINSWSGNPDNYTITETLGTLTVTKAPLTVETGSASKTYDGTPLTKDTYSVSGLADGESITVTVTGSRTDAGTSPNTFSISWSGADKDNYDLTEIPGVLEVKKKAATIATGSDSQEYNGMPISSTDAPMSGFLEGECPSVYPRGSQTDVGSSSNTYDIEWSAGVNKDNYDITETLGTLTVTARTLYVHTDSDEKTYDGTPLTAGASVYGQAPDEVITVTATGTITNVGSTSNTYTINWNGNKSTNYSIDEDIGTLTVGQLPVRLTANSTYDYDGEPHQAMLQVICDAGPTVTQKSLGVWRITFSWGDIIEVSIPTYESEPGNYPVTINTNMVSGKRDNYAIVTAESRLIINPLGE